MEPFTLELSVAELPESIVSRFPERPSATARVAVTIEPAGSETEKLASLRRELQAGIADLDAGRASDAAAVFVRLKERLGTA